MPVDDNHNPIPCLSLAEEGAHSADVTDTSVTIGPFDADTVVISIYATEPVFIAFGGSDVEAQVTDHYFPAGVYYDMALGGDDITHMATIAADSDGKIYISEKE